MTFWKDFSSLIFVGIHHRLSRTWKVPFILKGFTGVPGKLSIRVTQILVQGGIQGSQTILMGLYNQFRI